MACIDFLNEEKEVIVTDGSNLRLEAIDSGVGIYKTINKVLNCHGKGKCGSCMVEITAGGANLSSKTLMEEQKLKKKPVTYRLACQTLVMGNVAVKTKP